MALWFAGLPGPALDVLLAALPGDLHHLQLLDHIASDAVATTVQELRIPSLEDLARALPSALLARYPRLESLSLSAGEGERPPEPERVAELLAELLGAASRLTRLALRELPLCRASLQRLCQLPALESLRLHGCRLAAPLQPLSRLRSLHLHAAPSQPGLDALASLASLTALTLVLPAGGAPQQPQPLTPQLAPLTSLRSLHLEVPPHAGAAVSHFSQQAAQLTGLTSLHLAGFRPASWIDFTAVAALTALERLALPRAVLDFATSEVSCCCLRSLLRLWHECGSRSCGLLHVLVTPG
jgi:hypothetical protein